MKSDAARKSTLREYVEALIIAMIFVNYARIFVFQAFKIPSGSMIDNLLVGDHIVVNKFVFGTPAVSGLSELLPQRPIRRGDLVVFRYPRDRNTDFVKRVVGLPGESVSIRDKQVYIDGRKLGEPYKLHLDPNIYEFSPELTEPYRSRDQFGPYSVPGSSYFVMGDNRDTSYDSRYWGAVPRELIKGKPLLIYWSFRGRSALPGSPSSDRVRELLGVAFHFFSGTRWDRSFQFIDSEYHYHASREDLEAGGP